MAVHADFISVHLHNDREHRGAAGRNQDRDDLYHSDRCEFALLTCLAVDRIARGKNRTRRHGARVYSQSCEGTVRIITNRIDRGDVQEYEAKEKEKRVDNHIPSGEPILFFEVTPGDASEFSGVLKIRGETVDRFQILRTESPAVPKGTPFLTC
jgi:hypothetical protein